MNSGALSIFSLFVTRMADPNETALALSGGGRLGERVEYWSWRAAF